MLEPQSRTLLLDALEPPSDYKLDYAIGTTFTLDLVALLAAPLAFALLDRSGPDGKLSADPVALLEALRRNADRFSIFCQAGRISVPKPDRLLLSYLERNVIEVTAPQGGVFHPKVWALRFVADNAPVLYRFVCSSRNLTFDRSWDTIAVLEGELVDRKNAFAINHPLGDFFAELPGLAVGAIEEGIRQRINQFQNELRRVAFYVPDGFETYEFYPMGIGKYKKFLAGERIVRLLAVSPFVTADALEVLAEVASGRVHLVSRLEALQALPQDKLQGIDQISVFSDEQPQEDSFAAAAPESADALEPELTPELSGLHAKLYVADQGWQATIWTGSINATDAAFNRNVEFMLALTGKKSVGGIDALLDIQANQVGFRSFLKDYVPGQEATAVDELQRDLDQDLDAARLTLSCARLRVKVGQNASTDVWTLELIAPNREPAGLPQNLRIRVWPITCRSEAMGKMASFESRSGAVAVFTPLTFEALTSFVAFELELVRGHAAGRVQFVLNLPADGFPEDRAKRLLLRLLGNREAVMRYIQLLLDAGKSASVGEFDTLAPPAGGHGASGETPQADPLLEPLVRALHRDPARLDDVARLVEDLKEVGAGAQELPEGFDEIWSPIWQARQGLKDEKPTS